MYIWVAVEIMFMGNWPCPNWVVPYRLWRFWISWVFMSFHYLKWSRFQRLFHCDGVLISCEPWVACWPCVFSSLSWFCLRASSFNSGPCMAGAGIVCVACLLFLRALAVLARPKVWNRSFNNSWVNFLGPKWQDEIESGLSKCGACPSVSMKPYMKGIGRYRLGYRLRTPTFCQTSVSHPGQQ